MCLPLSSILVFIRRSRRVGLVWELPYSNLDVVLVLAWHYNFYDSANTFGNGLLFPPTRNYIINVAGQRPCSFLPRSLKPSCRKHYLNTFKHLAIMISLRLCSKSVVEQRIELQSLGYYVPSLPIPSISVSFFLAGREFKTGINRITQTPRNDTSGSPKPTGPWTAITSI